MVQCHPSSVAHCSEGVVPSDSVLRKPHSRLKITELQRYLTCGDTPATRLLLFITDDRFSIVFLISFRVFERLLQWSRQWDLVDGLQHQRKAVLLVEPFLFPQPHALLRHLGWGDWWRFRRRCMIPPWSLVLVFLSGVHTAFFG